MADRITEVRIAGLRAIEQLELRLDGLMVLIGENGTGKSSTIEALEILRRAARPVSFVGDVIVGRHGGLRTLLRRGSAELRLGVTIEGRGPALEYRFALADVGNATQVVDEHVFVRPHPGSGKLSWLARNQAGTYLTDLSKYGDDVPAPGTVAVASEPSKIPVMPDQLAVASLGALRPPGMQRIVDALETIEVHAAFETRPLWQQKELDARTGPRWPSQVAAPPTLARYGLNLPVAYHHIRNLDPAAVERVLSRLRLGIAPDLRNFVLRSPARGNIELELLFGRWAGDPLPAESLSEGQVAYLAFVALIELSANRCVLAFDEPEHHLHPSLLARVVMMLEEVAETQPVVLATHSDRLLDSLSDPAASVRLCELDENGATRLVQPNAESLAKWLEAYSGLGSIRAAGYERQVFDPNPWTGSDP